MAPRLGVPSKTLYDERFQNPNMKVLAQPVAQQDWERIVAYYLASAPDSLPPQSLPAAPGLDPPLLSVAPFAPDLPSSGIITLLPRLASSNLGRAALAGYLKTLAAEVARDGVTVNLVIPGRIATDRVAELDRAAADRAGLSVDEVRSASEAGIPAGRYGRPEEFAAAVTFLAGMPAGYITGSSIRCDGGIIANI